MWKAGAYSKMRDAMNRNMNRNSVTRVRSALDDVQCKARERCLLVA
jgi:hypothetical protein